MPYTVVISSPEAEVARTVGIGEVEGTLFTYEPSQSMALMTKLGEVDSDAALRLTDRIATILGRSLVAPKSAQPEVDLEQLFAPADSLVVTMDKETGDLAVVDTHAPPTKRKTKSSEVAVTGGD